MAYIGNTPAEKFSAFSKQDFTTSATTSYTLDNPVSNANEIALFINHVRQEPTTAYTAAGTALTLTSATAATDDMYCVYLGKAVQTVNPANGSVDTAQLADGAITNAKVEDGAIDNAAISSSAAIAPSKLGAGAVLQCKTTLAQTNQSTTSTSYTDITELTDLDITPSKVGNLILVQINLGCSTTNSARLGLDLQMKTGSGSYSSLLADTEVHMDTNDSGTNHGSYSLMYPHTTTTTDEHNFKLKFKSNNSSLTVRVNDNSSSSVTLWEIAG